jgi:hypothetical protein
MGRKVASNDLGPQHGTWNLAEALGRLDGRAISTAFVELLVNSLRSKRFSRSSRRSGHPKVPTSCFRCAPGH